MTYIHLIPTHLPYLLLLAYLPPLPPFAPLCCDFFKLSMLNLWGPLLALYTPIALLLVGCVRKWSSKLESSWRREQEEQALKVPFSLLPFVFLLYLLYFYVLFPLCLYLSLAFTFSSSSLIFKNHHLLFLTLFPPLLVLILFCLFWFSNFSSCFCFFYCCACSFFSCHHWIFLRKNSLLSQHPSEVVH
jgi:hypothetical protein